MIKDTVVMVSGAGGRIGSAIARGVISHGGKIILADINGASLEKVSLGLDTKHSLQIVADACVPEQVDLCIEKGRQKFGRIDAAVHAAYPHSSSWGERFENLKNKI